MVHSVLGFRRIPLRIALLGRVSCSPGAQVQPAHASGLPLSITYHACNAPSLLANLMASHAMRASPEPAGKPLMASLTSYCASPRDRRTATCQSWCSRQHDTDTCVPHSGHTRHAPDSSARARCFAGCCAGSTRTPEACRLRSPAVSVALRPARCLRPCAPGCCAASRGKAALPLRLGSGMSPCACRTSRSAGTAAGCARTCTLSTPKLQPQALAAWQLHRLPQDPPQLHR